MKRLNPPPQIRTDLSPSIDEPSLNQQPQLTRQPSLLTNEQTNKNLPPSSIYGRNLKKIKSYRRLRRNKKISIQKQVFINDLKSILTEFPVDQHQLDDELLVEVLSIAESYFIYGDKSDREQAKSEAVELLMEPYFRNDNDLFKKTVSHVWRKVQKSNLYKRLWSRLKFFFLRTVNV